MHPPPTPPSPPFVSHQFGPFAVLFGGNCLEHADYDTATSRWDALVLFKMWRRVRLHPCNSIEVNAGRQRKREGWSAAGSTSGLREDHQQPLKVKSISWRSLFYVLFFIIMCIHILPSLSHYSASAQRHLFASAWAGKKDEHTLELLKCFRV